LHWIIYCTESLFVTKPLQC